MKQDDCIHVAGHTGLVGSSLVRRLCKDGYDNLQLRTHAELDLTDQAATDAFYAEYKPAYVFLAAARVGGIQDNRDHPADFIRTNLQIQTNVIDAAWRHGCRKLIYFGSGCCYPRDVRQPVCEDALLTGRPEPTNEAFSLAKIAGLGMCQAYFRQYGFSAITAIAANLYGPGDQLDAEHAHVIPALMRRIHEAKRDGASSITLWGTGTPLREFLYIDDLADAAMFLMDSYENVEPINIASGVEVDIRTLAEMISEVVGWGGDIRFDPSHPDGAPRKCMDASRLTALGWRAVTPLREGLERMYGWFCDMGSGTSF